MTSINDSFAVELQAQLAGSNASSETVPDGCSSPARARQAGVDEDLIRSVTAQTLDIPEVQTLHDRPVSHEFLSAVPIAFARQHTLIGLAQTNDTVTVAMSDFRQWPAMETVGKLLARRVEALLAPRTEILRAINVTYEQQTGQAQNLIDQLDGQTALEDLDSVSNEDLLDVASRAPVIKLVNLVLLEAVKRGASDVHVQPYTDRLIVRFRIDGVLGDVFEPAQALHPEIISRIKIMGGMNIAEQRLAQDGRATVEVGDRIIDLRISTLPTSFGERAVIRLLDKSTRLFELGELGMPTNDLETFSKLIHMDHGIILVTGPTGSGKTTTLYAVLQEINSKELNILTLEDPIEYGLEGISQTQVSTRKGMTFATGLRHVLRQDPDIIMIGEIRDSETARMAIQSALTGHLVFSTLHTNDASGAVTRMLDLEVEPHLLASSLLGVLAQRLVRRLCPACREVYSPSAPDLLRWNMQLQETQGQIFYRPVGCQECMQTGYRGRVGIFEVLPVSESIRLLALQREKASTIKAKAIGDGMVSLRQAGLAKVAQGVTTMAEVARVTRCDDF